MTEKPKLIFKYRALSSRTDISRFYDIIKNNRLYLPTVLQVNDPFEGKNDISTGVAGSWYSRIMEKDPEIVKNCKERLRLLSLSADGFSPQLWAYYCHNYSGICLCYTTDRTFSTIRQVRYPAVIEEGETVLSPSEERIYRMITDSLFVKQMGWQYEREWRMVFQPCSSAKDKEISREKYLVYQPDELACVIIGNKMENDMKEIIRILVPERIKIFEVYTGAVSGKVKLKEYGYQYPGDGSAPDFITSAEELYNRLFTQ